MLEFESSYKEKFENYIRVFNTEKQKSESIAISNQYEYYKPYSKGLYKYVNDVDLKLEKFLGTSKDARDQYGVFNPIDRYVRDNFWQKSYNLNPRVWFLDIETRVGTHPTEKGFPKPENALEPVSLIQIYDNKTNTMYVFGYKDYREQEGYKLEYPVKYIKCKDELELFEVFLTIFKKMDPLIIYAWNGLGFDYPYLYNRMKRLGIDVNRLSNYGSVKCEKDERAVKDTDFKFDSSGHYFLDQMVVYKKFTYGNRPSYSLNYISEYELKERKVEHEEFGDFDSFYTGNKYNIVEKPYQDKVREEIRQLKIKERNGELTNELKERLEELLAFQFVYYGIKDVYLLKRIDEKLNFTNIIISISCEMGCSLEDSLGTVRPWSCGLQNLYYQNNMICPPKQEHENPNVIGGYVRDPVVGRHKWLINFDINSMYPMLSMKGFNMSPETYRPLSKLPSDLREHLMTFFNDQDESKLLKYSSEIWEKTKELLKKYNYSLGINGSVFDRTEIGIIPKKVGDIYFGRKKDKKTMLKYEQVSTNIREILDKRKNV